MSTVEFSAEQRVVMHGISWATYVALSDEPDRAGRRITYDRGELEIMSPSRSHELDKSMLGLMIKRFAEIHRIDISSSASTTFRRRDLERGFEPDESFYVQNELAVRGKTESDLNVDPPPDLVIEVERSRSAINKLELLASFGVPEVWRFNGQVLSVVRLKADDYVANDGSIVLPDFPIVEAERIMIALGTASETELIRQFVKVC